MSDGAELQPGQAVVLGLIHGPAELLPVSSSGHMTLVPWLLGWDCQALDPELQKSFEVALHAAAGGALLIGLQRELRDSARAATRRPGMAVALSLLPPALVGCLLERPIERRLGQPGTIATGLVAGSVAMLAGDRGPVNRACVDVTAADALWLGAAQAAALMPGVSRNGATLAVARHRGFSREDADVLSRRLALPIIAAAAARRLGHRQALPRHFRAPLASGMLAAFASTLTSSRIAGRRERSGSLLPYVAYRLGLAGIVGGRLLAQRAGRRHHGPTTDRRLSVSQHGPRSSPHRSRRCSTIPA